MKPATVLPPHRYYAEYKYAPDEIPLEDYVLPASPAELAEIPAPESMRRLQRSDGRPPLMSPSSSTPIPPPFPPSRLKSELLESSRYEAGLDRIRTLDLRPPAGSDLAGLCERVFADCPADLDRTVAAFGLVCRLCERRDELAQLPCLAQRSAGKPDWQSEVFEAVMSLSGVPCQRLEGHKKGLNYRTGHRSHVGGSWFACFLDGEWRHVDAIWGSAGLPPAASADSAASEAAVAAAAVAQRNDFYFLTDPALLAFSHHPLWPEPAAVWQLLVRPVSLPEFHRLPAYFDGNKSAMALCQLDPVNCPLNVIPSPGGVVDLLLQQPADSARHSCSAKVLLRPVASGAAPLPSTQTAAGPPVDALTGDSVSKPIRLSSGQVRLKFLAPRAGRFELRIGLTMADEDEELHFAAYIVHCPAAAPDPARLPAGQLPEFGLTDEAERLGVRLQLGEPIGSPAQPELAAEDGEASWWLTAPTPLGDDPNEPLQCHVTFGGQPGQQPGIAASLNRHLLQWSINGGRERGFRFLAPHSGWFAVTIWCDANRLRPLGELLIVADSAAAGAQLGLPENGLLGWPAAEAEDDYDVGGRRRSRRRLVDDIRLTSPTLPGGGREPCLIVRHETELVFAFRTQGRHVAKAAILPLQDSQARPLEESVLVNGAQDGFQVHVRFPRPGNYLLEIKVHPRRDDETAGGSDSLGAEGRLLCRLLLRALSTAERPSPAFPLVLDHAAASDYQLLQPLARQMPVRKAGTVIRLAPLESSSASQRILLARINDGDSLQRRLPFSYDGSTLSLSLGQDELSIRSRHSLTVVTKPKASGSSSDEEVPILSFELLPDAPTESSVDEGAVARRASIELTRSESRRRWQRENWRRAANEGLEPLAWDAEQWEQRTAEALAEQQADREAEMKRRDRLLEAQRLQEQLLSLVEAAFPNVLNRVELVGAVKSANSGADSGATEAALDALVEQRRLFPRTVPGGTAYLLQEELSHATETASRGNRRLNRTEGLQQAAVSAEDRWGMGRVRGFNRANFADLQLLRRSRPTVALVTRLMCEKRALDAVTVDKESFVQYETRAGGSGDSHVYTLGRIGTRSVVSTKLPAVVGAPGGLQARVACGNVVTRLLGVFQDVEHILLVGVGGSAGACRLGDIVIGDDEDCDYFEAASGRIWRASDRRLIAAARAVAEEMTDDGGADWIANLESLAAEAPAFNRPPRTSATTPTVAFGPVACGETIATSSTPSMNAKPIGADAGFDEVLESALGSRCPSFLLIRGCADFHTGEQGLLWQPFAALTAACFAAATVQRLGTV